MPTLFPALASTHKKFVISSTSMLSLLSSSSPLLSLLPLRWRSREEDEEEPTRETVPDVSEIKSRKDDMRCVNPELELASCDSSATSDCREKSWR